MGAGSVAPGAAKSPKVGGASWELASPHQKNAQGLIVSSFPHLPAGAALLLNLSQAAGGAWLRELMQAVAITDASGKRTPAAALALTCTGLREMGLDENCLTTFSPAFVEGMRQIDRQRRLGDGVLDPTTNETVVSKETVIPDGPIWSGNAPELHPILEEASAKRTPMTVHAALLLYDEHVSGLDTLIESARKILAGSSVAIVRRIDLSLQAEPDRLVHEHFGFVDGISQPVPYGPTIVPDERDPWHAVAAGDLLIGHLTTDGDPAPGPIVSVTMPGADVLPEGVAPFGFRDLGLDGTYLVIRELRQDVEAFWRSTIRASRSLGHAKDYTWLAERVVGRTLGGNPLAPGSFKRSEDGDPANEFGYRHDDPHGLGCPIGSHMRRANPRDGLAPNPSEAQVFLNASNRHRILRRGRKFGPVLDVKRYAEQEAELLEAEQDTQAQNAERRPDPEAEGQAQGPERGLLFIAINTDITRQFEFVQQTWVLNKSFSKLSGETDPLVGPRGPFTVPEKWIRSRPEVETFVRLIGGDYFFLPSLAALKYLAQLK